MEEKGITEAIEAIRAINEENGKLVATLDIYGQVEPNYETKLNDLIATNSSCVAYKGVCDSQGSVDVLKNYYALLFPTHWVGEGLPGTIIDSFASGIPVIASDWNANKEIIEHNRQGIIYPNQDMKTLKDAIVWSMQETTTMASMRTESRAAFEQYTPNAIWQAIFSKMNESK